MNSTHSKPASQNQVEQLARGMGGVLLKDRTMTPTGWHRIPNSVTDRIAEIGVTAFAVYGVLARHVDDAGRCWPSVARIARIIDRTDRTVQAALRQLQVARLIVSEPRSSDRGTITNVYRLLTPPEPGETSFTRCNQFHHPGETSFTTPVKPVSPKQDPLNKTQEQDPRKKLSCRALRFDVADRQVAEWMFSKIQELNPEHTAPNLDQWANTIRLMREKDHRTLDQIRALFAWANADSFWRTNILCPTTLRKQWDKLTIKQRSTKNGNGFAPGPGQRYTPGMASTTSTSF